MNSDEVQQWRTPTQLFQQGIDSILVFGLGWLVVNEKRGKQELLNHYRIILDIANLKALQEQPRNTHKVHFLEKQCNAVMKIYLPLSNLEHSQS